MFFIQQILFWTKKKRDMMMFTLVRVSDLLWPTTFFQFLISLENNSYVFILLFVIVFTFNYVLSLALWYSALVAVYAILIQIMSRNFIINESYWINFFFTLYLFLGILKFFVCLYFILLWWIKNKFTCQTSEIFIINENDNSYSLSRNLFVIYFLKILNFKFWREISDESLY